MSFKLVIGNKNYSSWSMRAWLLIKYLDLEFEEINIKIYTEESRNEVRALGGVTGLVPVLIHNELSIWDTMAITEYLNEIDNRLWPKKKEYRAIARSLCGEVHSGLTALREAMPVNTRARNLKTDISENVIDDIQRVSNIWNKASSLKNGEWLFGEFSAVDIFFAPVATRFQTYGVEIEGKEAANYQKRLLSHPLVNEWIKAGEKEPTVIEQFE